MPKLGINYLRIFLRLKKLNGLNLLFRIPLGTSWKPTSLPKVPIFKIEGPNKFSKLGKDDALSKRMEFWYQLPFNTKIHNKIYELKKLYKDEL